MPSEPKARAHDGIADGRSTKAAAPRPPARRPSAASTDSAAKKTAGNVPIEDPNAPFGAWVRKGETKTITFDGATLEIPKGAVDHDVRITIRPLAEAEVPPMDRGMTNVTPLRHGYRFGPHHLRFKKPVRISLPTMLPSLLPA
jgi:hypothetical protein